ncbi:hypothetical protein [Legionella taurinensis]|uniref:hypothetical protein n=1 Tax=Legionella taurinensis TaxID=70611 RepID=UPI000DFDD133|nr:hypothetical protein [Legionella taurinensis]MDX1838616.1 hypothetical protein [Legionella taurinensis]STY27131.1 Uncharacterised protein [Legionella taurinensis]
MNRDVTRDIPANFFAHFQRPFIELTELQMRTLNDFSYLKPEEISRIRQPRELFEKNMECFIENAHKSLDFMQEAFRIVEKNMMSLSSNVRESSERVMSQVEHMNSQKGRHAQEGKRTQSERSERGEKQQDDKQSGAQQGGRGASAKDNK